MHTVGGAYNHGITTRNESYTTVTIKSYYSIFPSSGSYTMAWEQWYKIDILWLHLNMCNILPLFTREYVTHIFV